MTGVFLKTLYGVMRGSLDVNDEVSKHHKAEGSGFRNSFTTLPTAT